MIDFVGLFTTGGVILFSKYLEDGARQSETREELRGLIRDCFLSEKSAPDQKYTTGQHVFLFERDLGRGLVYVVCQPSGFDSDISQAFLSNLVDQLGSQIPETKDQIQLANYFLAQGDLWPQVSDLLYKTFEEIEAKKSGKPATSTAEKKLEAKPKAVEQSKKPNAKVATQWDPLLSSSNKPSSKKATDDALNYNKDAGQETVEDYRKKFLESPQKSDPEEFVDITSDDEEELKEVKPSLFGRFKTSLAKFAEGKALDEKALKPILASFKDELIKKNVAYEIAEKICANLGQKLANSKGDLMTSTKSLVKAALKDSVTSILTPRNNIDLLAMALKKKEEGRPFVVVFIGVNGVGKSTNLAKVAYMFKTNGFSVLLAACDNFRSGAVEQLKKHAECLDVPIFERGYKDDSANIARDAIAEATQKKIDVVLVDTAGRMQDNEPLMRALAKLVNSNNPDVVLFIGEALTGNDGVDQLTKFNSALKELSAQVQLGAVATGKQTGREIDGILLSKFDTVDDKVGAALSLTYATGKPIVYLGVGQKYQNLQKPNIDVVVRSLLK
jgi:signal recognition particle receptor subunit alpha